MPDLTFKGYLLENYYSKVGIFICKSSLVCPGYSGPSVDRLPGDSPLRSRIRSFQIPNKDAKTLRCQNGKTIFAATLHCALGKIENYRVVQGDDCNRTFRRDVKS